MKKIGRGTAYKKALLNNLISSLNIHKKIQTTKTRGNKLVSYFASKKGVSISLKPQSRRRGDNAQIVSVEILENTIPKKI